MKGQIFRIAHLGYFDFSDLFAMIAQLEIILAANGVPVEFGKGRRRRPEGLRGSGRCQGDAKFPRLSSRQFRRMKILDRRASCAAGIELLKAQPGWDVIVSNPKEYAQHLAEADALIVRSAVKVNPSVLAKAPKLRVIGRAGVGVDNVDLAAATAAGVLVMNTPGGNAVSVAEHTLALMLAMARAIPQASASTKAGKWEKKKFMGSELRGKTLGVIGLGSIGREVVKRARAVRNADRRARSLRQLGDRGRSGCRTGRPEDALRSRATTSTLHMALTPETQRMLSTRGVRQMKPGVRIVNCARGELVDEAALNEAMASGKVAGAGLDVFDKEPPAAEAPLLAAGQR